MTESAEVKHDATGVCRMLGPPMKGFEEHFKAVVLLQHWRGVLGGFMGSVSVLFP